MKSRQIPRSVVAIAVGCVIFPLLAMLWVKMRPAPAPPFAFPTTELAAIDRDLQARFAVVPDKDFGIERTYGNQHYLYNPNTPAERAHVAALKKQKTEAAFYLMSRALWLRSWDGAGYKPIQGPVAITGKIKAPIPRKINFEVRDNSRNEAIMDQEGAIGVVQQSETGIETHNPDGTPVPSPTTPTNLPGFNRLQQIGNQVFELVEGSPVTAKIGVTEKLKDWQVVAVPIRASDKKCLPCHTYDPLTKREAPGKLKIEVGDALGVAFYAYRRDAKAK